MGAIDLDVDEARSDKESRNVDLPITGIFRPIGIQRRDELAMGCDTHSPFGANDAAPGKPRHFGRVILAVSF
jgi:hypothetical protein